MDEQEEELENLLNKGALWAITYGDLMSYLMIFFLLMFTFSLRGKTGVQGLSAMQEHFGGQAESEALKRIEQKGRESALAKELEKNFQVKVTEEKINVVLDEKILFDSGSADLKPAVFPSLNQLADLLRTVTNKISIEGHTDDVPIRNVRFQSNFELSMARATSVLRYLIEREKIDPRRLSAAGYGEYHPVAPNDSPENRAQNRRIEIVLVRVQ